MLQFRNSLAINAYYTSLEELLLTSYYQSIKFPIKYTPKGIRGINKQQFISFLYFVTTLILDGSFVISTLPWDL